MSNKSATVHAAAGLVHASRKAYARKWSFLAAFFVVLLVTTGVAGALDALPDPQVKVADAAKTTQAASPLVAIAAPEQPTKIYIPAISLTTTVSNPTTTDISVLDNALLKGAVRYPSSSNLGEAGNVIIFGHSSYLPIVNNKAFKTFDGIQKLKQGDRIEVTGSGHTYVYAVDTVAKENTADDAIPLDVQGSKLTLATCDSFGEKSDRFVVTATLVETDPIAAGASS